MILNNFVDKLTDLRINYTEEMLNQLEIYCNYLIEYNKHTNLTAIKEPDDIYLKHFYDSLTIVKSIDLNNVNSLLDIGSGAGFPGIVLKIFFPNLKVTILDSNNKKTTFVKSLVDKLNLKDVTVINKRAEDYAKENNKYDVITSRAVAYIDIITTLSSYFAHDNSYIILMKGNIDEEKAILDNHIEELNVISYEIINCNLDEQNIRNIVKIKINNHNLKILNYSQIVKRHEKWTNK